MGHVDEESKPLKDLDIVTIKKDSASLTIMGEKSCSCKGPTPQT